MPIVARVAAPPQRRGDLESAPMNRLLFVALSLLAFAWPAVAAQDDAPPDAPEPKVERRITEDDLVRIEEVRVRGQTQSITVKSKGHGIRPPDYEVVPATGARDPSVAGQSNGRRVWQFFSF